MRPIRSTNARGSRRRRRGKLTVEFIIVLPILLIASIGVFQFAVAMTIEQAVVHAATVAAREAAKGADADDLVNVVEEVLATHDIVIGDHASLVLEDGMAPPEQRGMLACGPALGPMLTSGQVRVTVCVDMAERPFINPLKFYGIDLAGKTFQTSSILTKEELN